MQYIVCTSTIIKRQSRLVFLSQKRYTVNNNVTVLEDVAIKEGDAQRNRYRQQQDHVHIYLQGNPSSFWSIVLESHN